MHKVAVMLLLIGLASPSCAEPVLNNETDIGVQGQSSASGSAGVQNAEKAARETGQSGDDNTTINAPVGTRKNHRRHHETPSTANLQGTYQTPTMGH